MRQQDAHVEGTDINEKCTVPLAVAVVRRARREETAAPGKTNIGKMTFSPTY